MKANIRAKYNNIKLTSPNMIIIKLITTEDEETELKYTLKKKRKKKKVYTLPAKSSLSQKISIKYKTHAHTINQFNKT